MLQMMSFYFVVGPVSLQQGEKPYAVKDRLMFPRSD